jgi:Flp pilus assembly pilin Flp
MLDGKRGRVRIRSHHILADDELGAAAIEYAMLGSLIAAVIALVVGVLGTKVFALFQRALNIFP